MNTKLYEFITGVAGSGKTTLIKNRIKTNPHYALLTSSTGIAAINLSENAVTLASALKYFDTESMERSYKEGWLTNWARKAIKGYHNLVIEEASMLPAKQLDIIYSVINELNAESKFKKGLILVGDLLQLSPINAPYMFEANCWSEFKNNTLKLEKVWRQTNAKFIDFLNYIRAAKKCEVLDLIPALGVEFRSKLDTEFKGTTILPTNNEVKQYNIKKLKELEGNLILCEVKREGKQLNEWTKYLPIKIGVKIGAYIMIISNAKDLSYCNGDCGTVVDYQDDIFYIKLIRNNVVVKVKRISRNNLSETHPSTTNYREFRPHTDFLTGKWVIGKVNYHPIRLAWASTVHKCICNKSLIYTELGLRQAKDVQIGERIYNGNEYVTVINKQETLKSATRIQLEYGQVLICSPEHKFPLYNSLQLKEVNNLKIGDKLILGSCSRLGCSNIVNSDLAYLIGVIIGDGSYRNRKDGTIEIASLSWDIQSQVKRIIEDLNIKFHIRKDKKGTYFINKEFRRMLENTYKMKYVLAKDKHIPNLILTSNVEARTSFLRGLYDSDGSVSDRTIVFCTASKMLGFHVQNLLASLGILSSRSYYTNDYDGYWQIRIPRIFHNRFYKLVGFNVKYKQDRLALLANKKPRQNTLLSFRKGYSKIVSIKNLEIETPMIDFEVSGNNLFIANGIVTHNSQGLTLDNIQMDINNSFFGKPSMIYVACSRARTAEGLKIIGSPKLFENRINIDEKVRRWI